MYKNESVITGENSLRFFLFVIVLNGLMNFPLKIKKQNSKINCNRQYLLVCSLENRKLRDISIKYKINSCLILLQYYRNSIYHCDNNNIFKRICFVIVNNAPISNN